MLIIAFFNFVVVIFAYLAYKHHSDIALKISFVFIFLFLALRYDFGNDYQSYLENFIAINQGIIVWESEPGWVLLCRFFGPFGFFVMTAFLAAVQSVVYYRFFKKYVPVKYYWLALFIYLFNPSCFLILSSAMRQSVALVIFVFSIDYIYKKRFVRYFICIALASTFHSSALIFFPVYLIGLVDWKVNKITALIFFIIYPLMYLFLSYLQVYVSQFVEIYFHVYERYLDRDMGKIGSGIGFIFSLFLLWLIIIKLGYQVGEKHFLFKISILSYYFTPFAFINPMIGRIGMYFEPFMIVVFTAVLMLIRARNVRFAVIALYSVIVLFSFYGFFQSDIWRESYGQYKTIFSAPGHY